MGKYNDDYKYMNKYGGEEECDGCLQFKCSNDGGNTVIFGSGCWDDFVYACPVVLDDVKEGIKRNINDSFYNGKNYKNLSCRVTKGWITYCPSFLHDDYEYFNPSAEKMFMADVNKSYDDQCEIDFATTPSLPSSPSTATEASPRQANYFELNEFVLIGLIFIINFL